MLACIGNDAYKQFSHVLKTRYADAPCVLLCDSQTENKHKDIVDACIKESGGFKIAIPDMDKNRTITHYGEIIDALSAKGIAASSLIIAFGETAILSVAGFVAATYRGGMRLVVVPLSLRAFLDSSVGETWIIDGAQCEAAAGLRYNPSMAWFDTASFVNAPDVEYAFSLAEFFRYAFFGGKDFFDAITGKWEALLKKDLPTIAECARLCIAARASITAQCIDGASKEAALRFAQSLAGAIASSGKSVLNPGQALFRAMACLCEAAKRSGALAPQSSDAYVKLLQKMPPFQMPELLDHSKVFQKAFGPQSRDFGRSSVALPSIAGNVIAKEEIPEKILQEVLKSFLSAPKEPAEKKK
jgi:3-dehydroquinate synthase